MIYLVLHAIFYIPFTSSNSNVQRNWSWILLLFMLFRLHRLSIATRKWIESESIFWRKKKVYKIYTSVSIVANTSGACALLAFPHFPIVHAYFVPSQRCSSVLIVFIWPDWKGRPFMLASILFRLHVYFHTCYVIVTPDAVFPIIYRLAAVFLSVSRPLKSKHTCIKVAGTESNREKERKKNTLFDATNVGSDWK